jgi:hypothetical protein
VAAGRTQCGKLDPERGEKTRAGRRDLSGFVVGPPIMGWLAQTSGLRATIGLMVLATIGVVVAGIRSVARRRREPEGTTDPQT